MKTIKPAAACCLAAAAFVASLQPALALDSPALNLARQLNEAFVDAAAEVTPSVVVIDIRQKVNDTEGDTGSFWDLLPPEYRRHFQHPGGSSQHWLEGEGSGIIVSPDGYILTNYHVVENADQIVVSLPDGRKFPGEVKGTDSESDIAVVKINATALKPAKLGDSDKARVGEFVLAVGAPFELNGTVTVGHISAKSRVFQSVADQDFIQTDTKILPGNSGGPLVNLYGEVVGINTMIEGLDTGIGFAIPVNIARRVKDHLIAEGKFTRSWLGIEIVEWKNQGEYVSITGTPPPATSQGVLVTGIVPDGPASKSDLRAGDVVTAVDGKSVQTVRELRDEVSVKKAGRNAVLNVTRGNARLTVKVAPGAMPSAEGLNAGISHFREPEPEPGQ